MNKKIITAQSQVANGYVGNNIASLAVQLHGLDPVQLPTVILSNHVEYPKVYGQSTRRELFAKLIKGIKENQFIQQCSFLITGFCDNKDIISELACFIKDTKEHTGYKYVYDPVYGDFRAGGLYLSKEIADTSLTTLLPFCNILTPNHFELEYILNEKVFTKNQFLNSVQKHPILRSKTVLATGMHLNDTEENFIEVLLYLDGKVERFNIPQVAIDVIGTGDLFTAVFASQLCISNNIKKAITRAMKYVHIALQHTKEKGYRDFNAETLIKYAPSYL